MTTDSENNVRDEFATNNSQQTDGSCKEIIAEKKVPQKWTLIRIVGLVAIVFLSKHIGGFLGGATGKAVSEAEVQKAGVTLNAPQGFLNAKWYMSIEEVQALFPDAQLTEEKSLRIATEAFDRPAIIDFIFTDNCLLLIAISFVAPNNPELYQKTQIMVSEQYGTFSEPKVRDLGEIRNVLYSEKFFGPIAMSHLRYALPGMFVEQVLMYKRKGQ